MDLLGNLVLKENQEEMVLMVWMVSRVNLETFLLFQLILEAKDQTPLYRA
jgi:hypothetical protein